MARWVVAPYVHPRGSGATSPMRRRSLHRPLPLLTGSHGVLLPFCACNSKYFTTPRRLLSIGRKNLVLMPII